MMMVLLPGSGCEMRTGHLAGGWACVFVLQHGFEIFGDQSASLSLHCGGW